MTFLTPADAGWDDARRAWNLAVDQHPAAIAEPMTVAQLQDAVRSARRNGLRIAPQSTGHGAHALGPLDDALLLKTTHLRGVETRPTSLRAEAGVLAADAASAAGELGRAPVLGFAPTVGVTGLSVSGGIGWLGRTHGLAANDVEAFDVVLADGEQARVDADHEPELFWALRGGGGRGAIVTALELATHAVPGIYAGSIAWPADRVGEVLEQFRRCTMVAPEALTLVLRFIAPLDLVMVLGTYLGSEGDAIAALAPLRSGRGAVHDTFGPVAPEGLVRIAGDPEEPTGGQGDGFLLAELPLDAVEQLAALLSGDGFAPLGMLELRHLGGALSRTPREHGALARLDAGYSLYVGSRDADPELVTARCTQLREELKPWTASQSLLSLMRPGTDPATAFDPDSWERLRRVRDTYDPDGVLVTKHDLYAELA